MAYGFDVQTAKGVLRTRPFSDIPKLKMKYWHLLVIFFLLIHVSGLAAAQEVVVQEAWSIHMESSGGWVAAEKGFYGKFSVREIQGGPGVSPIQNVLDALRAGTIAFGVGSPENVLLAREKQGIDLVAVSVDFQTSAMRIVSWKPVRSARDIRGDFAVWPGYEAKVKCAVGKGWEKQLTLQGQGEEIKPWLAGDWSFASAMTYNELITAQREVKMMGRRFYTVDFRDLGIDWTDNVVFTTGEIAKKNPEIVQAVVSGRYRGFQWAFENPRDAFEILKKNDPGLDFGHEFDAVSPLKALVTTADTRRSGLGFVDPKKWENVARDMFKAGLLSRMANVRDAYTEKFPSGVMPR
jgi:NitT/TauT family transport system substrate-binding protein